MTGKVLLGAVIAMVSLATASPAAAGRAAKELAREFGITTYYVTRESDDLYEVSLQNIVVRTNYCYVYAYSEEAVITDNKIIFLDSDDVCDIEGIYSKR